MRVAAGRRTALLLVCGLVLLATPATGGPLQWSGSAKSLDLYGGAAPAGQAPDYLLSSNRLRLGALWDPGGAWRAEAAADYRVVWSDAEAWPLTGDDVNRRFDLEHTWRYGRHAAGRLQLDRLNLGWQSANLDITLGRQAIGFGRILVASPLDIIAPFAPDAIDTDVRSGIDALRVTVGYAVDGQVGAIAVPGRDRRHSSLLATWSDNRHGVDLLMLGGRLRGRGVLGAGLAGNLGPLGLKGEVSVHDGRSVGTPGGDLHQAYTLAAVEGWYRFTGGLSLVVEYLYNGPGVDQPEDYPQVLASPPLREGLTYLLGRHYLLAAPSYEIHPLATLQGLLICNLADRSTLLRPTLDLSLADNLGLQLFWTWHTGRSPVRASTDLPAVPRSEFGMRGSSGGLFLRWYF